MPSTSFNFPYHGPFLKSSPVGHEGCQLGHGPGRTEHVGSGDLGQAVGGGILKNGKEFAKMHLRTFFLKKTCQHFSEVFSYSAAILRKKWISRGAFCWPATHCIPARGPYPIILPDFYRRGPPEEISVHVGEVPPAELAQLPEKVAVAEGEVVYGPVEREMCFENFTFLGTHAKLFTRF